MGSNKAGTSYMNQIYSGYFENIYLKNIICRLSVCPPNWGETNTRYRFYKFYYFLGGEGTIIIDNDFFHPEPEELLLIPADKVHTFYQNPENPVCKYWCHFELILNEGRKLRYSKDTFKCRIKKTEIAPLFENLIKLAYTYHPLNELDEKSLLLGILKKYLERVDLGKVLPVNSNSFTHKVNEYINQNISKEITISQLAKTVNVHPNYFIKLFKKNFFVTPIEYINTIRIQYAARLLAKDKNKNINEIANAAGFKEYGYFARVFKKKYGLTPSQYKTSYANLY